MIAFVDNEIYTKLKTEITAAKVRKEYPEELSDFPCIVANFSNTTNPATIDTSGERHNFLSIQINIFSQSQLHQTEIQTIRGQIDAVLADFYKMNRTLDDPVSNIDPTITRWIMRYEGVISYNNEMYRR